MPTLTIEALPPLVFAGAQIVDVGALRLSGGGASPTVEIALDPGHGALAQALDLPPLRVRATVLDDEGRVFVGIVQSIRLGLAPSLTLEV